MRHVTLIGSEPFRSVLQGNGIRFLEMATELAREHRVTLLVPNADVPGDLPFPVLPFQEHGIDDWLTRVDVVIAQGHASDRYLEALATRRLGAGPPLIVDLYDPFLANNLRYASTLGREIYYRDRAVLVRQLSAGDFFLTSSEMQRMFYIGLLVGMGCLTPEMYERDRTLRSVIDVAPFGVRPVAPESLFACPRRLKGVVPGIFEDDLVVFFGGVYDWYDPGLLLDVLDDVLRAHPTLRVVFSINPNPETTPQGKFASLQERSRSAAWTGRHVFFLPWFPYQDRFGYLRDVDVALSLHEPSLETDLSLRTRILDYMNAGVPVVATAGGEGAHILEVARGGIVIAPSSRPALRHALMTLLEHPRTRREMGHSGRQWVQQHMSWEEVLRPLKAFCAYPRKLPRREEAIRQEIDHPLLAAFHRDRHTLAGRSLLRRVRDIARSAISSLWARRA